MELMVIAGSMVLGGVFLVSGSHKMRHPDAFRATVAAVGIRPRVVVSVVVAGTVVSELLVPLMLIDNRTRAAGLVLALGLLCAFNVVIGVSLRRATGVPCNCFRLTSRPLGWPQFLRNCALIAVSIGALASGARVDDPSVGAIAVCAGFAVIAVLLFVFFDDLAELVSGREPTLTPAEGL